MVPIGKETMDFVHACETLHALLAIGRLTSAEQELIEFTSNSLLLKVRPAGLTS